jgi:hypothetical protein
MAGHKTKTLHYEDREKRRQCTTEKEGNIPSKKEDSASQKIK